MGTLQSGPPLRTEERPICYCEKIVSQPCAGVYGVAAVYSRAEWGIEEGKDKTGWGNSYDISTRVPETGSTRAGPPISGSTAIDGL